MRLIGIGILILSGAIMASAGFIAKAINDNARGDDIVAPGGFMVFVGCVLFLVELILGYRRKNSERDSSGR